MALDAGMLNCIARELDELRQAKIEKIHQPSQDEIVIALHSAKAKIKLLINVGSNNPRINITEANFENPQKAPMLCMLLRKHLNGGKLLGAKCYGFERIVDLEFEAYDELGFKSSKHLICELMGKYSNLILTDSEGKILALTRPVDFSSSSQRHLLVGMKYSEPEKQDKIDTEALTKEQFLKELDNAPREMRVDKLLSSRFSGIAISTARQVAYKQTGCIDSLVCEVDSKKVCDYFFEIIDGIKNGTACPYLVLNEKKEPQEYSYVPLEYFGKGFEIVQLESFGKLLDTFFQKKGSNERIRQKSADILKLLTNAENRILRKISLQTQELNECESLEEYRIMADLITANLHAIRSGMQSVEVVNYYDENMGTIKIPLDNRISPSQNAQRYYKKYSKLKKAKIELVKQIELSKIELDYIATVFDSLTKAEGEGDLSQIRDELYHSGYASRMKNYSLTKSQAPKPLKFRTSGGYTLLVGKNNIQNDYITMKLAEKTDWWFHVKNMPGSHVLMQCDKEEPSELDFTEACELAAFYSKAEGNNIAVDYTKAKHVKKPAGAKPGYVIYHINWTAYVTPSAEKIEKMKTKA